jgi:hypothetical protein
MTREEIEQRIDELARKYVDTDVPEIPYKIYEMARRSRRWGRSEPSHLILLDSLDKNHNVH